MNETARKLRPTVPELAPLIDAFYGFPQNGVGGVLHIVLDDQNIDDDSVKFCIESAHAGDHWANPTPGEPDEAGELLGYLLLLCSKTQRSKLSRDGTRGEHRMERADFIVRCRELLAKYQTDSQATPPPQEPS